MSRSSRPMFFHVENIGAPNPPEFSDAYNALGLQIPAESVKADRQQLPTNIHAPRPQIQYQTFDIDFSDTDWQRIDCRFNFLDLTDATDTTGYTPILYVKIEDEQNDIINLRYGKSYRGLTGTKIFIKGNGVAETGQLLLAFDPTAAIIESA